MDLKPCSCKGQLGSFHTSNPRSKFGAEAFVTTPCCQLIDFDGVRPISGIRSGALFFLFFWGGNRRDSYEHSLYFGVPSKAFRAEPIPKATWIGLDVKAHATQLAPAAGRAAIGGAARGWRSPAAANDWVPTTYVSTGSIQPSSWKRGG